MQVAIIHHQFKMQGGMETYLFNLIAGFNQQKDHVTAYVYKRTPSLTLPNCEVKQNHLFWMPRVWRKFWFGSRINQRSEMLKYDLRISLMRSLNQDIIICGGTHLGFLAGTKKKRGFLDRLEIAREKKSYHSSKYILAHSEMLKQELVNLYSVPEEKIIMSNPPLDPGKFNQALRGQRLDIRNKLNINPEKKVILFPSTGHKRKGFFLLIEALKLLPIDEFELVVAGNQPPKTSCANVQYVGFVKDMALLYSACDVTVLPSLYEPFGLVVIESIECGTPVIVSNTVGAKDLISENEGIVLKDCSPHAIASAILQVCKTQFTIEPFFAERMNLTIDAHVNKIKSIEDTIAIS